MGRLAKKNAGLELIDGPGEGGTVHRIEEECLEEGERVVVRGCVSPASGAFEPCLGAGAYMVVSEERLQASLETAKAKGPSSVAGKLGWAFLSLLVGLLALTRSPTPLIDQLATRTTSRRRLLEPLWVWCAIGLAVFVFLPIVASRGFAWAIVVVALWLFATVQRWSYRARTIAALAPVLDTPRSLLAEANGTVELAVRARMRGVGVRSFLGDDVVAFSELRIREVYYHPGHGRSSGYFTSRMARVHRATEQLEIVDESGEGELHLDAASVLDTEVRRTWARRIPPRIADRGIALPPPGAYYAIEESVIKDGEPLYVFGEVSNVELRSGAGDYRARTVRGSPTIGGRGTPPVVVYAGSERGLIGKLRAHARVATALFAAAVLASVTLTAALVYLAWS